MLLHANPGATAGIAFNHAADLGGSDSVSSWTAPYTLGAGSNLLVVLVDGSDATDDLSGVTYAGAAMTLGWKFSGAPGVYDALYAFFLPAPAAGTHDVVITSGSSHRIRAVAADYTGVRATGQPDAISPGFISQPGLAVWTDTVTTVAPGAWAILGFLAYSGGAAPIAGSGCTRRTYGAFYGMPALFDSAGPIVSPGAYSMTVNTTTAVPGGMRIVSFAPA